MKAQKKTKLDNIINIEMKNMRGGLTQCWPGVDSHRQTVPVHRGAYRPSIRGLGGTIGLPVQQ